MALVIEHCSEEDMDRTFELLSLSFGHEHPLIEAIYPSHDTPSGRYDGAERLRATKNSDPHTTFLKVVDTSVDKIIGMAKWNIYNGVIPEEEGKLEGDYWATEEAKELAEWYTNEYTKLRRDAIKESGGNLVCKFSIFSFCLPSVRGEYTLAELRLRRNV